MSCCQGGGQAGEGEIESVGLADANYYYRVDIQQVFAVEHRELYSLPCDKP